MNDYLVYRNSVAHRVSRGWRLHLLGGVMPSGDGHYTIRSIAAVRAAVDREREMHPESGRCPVDGISWRSDRSVIRVHCAL